MLKKIGMISSGMMFLALLACSGGMDPDIRRGEVFFGNREWTEAIKMYEQALKRNPQAFDLKPEFKEHFKNAYYYRGGEMEGNGSLEAALKYYESGFDLIPNDAPMCDKLAKYYWKEEDFEPAVKYFSRLVELDANLPDEDKKWEVMHQDYYALGYSLIQLKKYSEGIEALQQCIKANKKGEFVQKAKSAIESAKFEMKKAK
jgi:tetratricopeptide (TPR) repeat protein